MCFDNTNMWYDQNNSFRLREVFVPSMTRFGSAEHNQVKMILCVPVSGPLLSNGWVVAIMFRASKNTTHNYHKSLRV